MLLSLFYFVKQFSTFQDVNAGSGLMGVVLQHVVMSIQLLYCGLEQCFLKIFESCSLEVVCLFFFFPISFSVQSLYVIFVPERNCFGFVFLGDTLRPHHRSSIEKMHLLQETKLCCDYM